MTREGFHVIITFGSHIILVLMIFLLPNFFLRKAKRYKYLKMNKDNNKLKTWGKL